MNIMIGAARSLATVSWLRSTRPPFGKRFSSSTWSGTKPPGKGTLTKLRKLIAYNKVMLHKHKLRPKIIPIDH